MTKVLQVALRCASWKAVSSKRQADDKKMSLDRQDEINADAIQKIGGVCVASLVVKESRSIILFEDACNKVQAYRQLKELVDTRAIDVLVCYTHSRLGREISLCESVVAYCLAGGVAIYDCCAPPSSLDAGEQKRNAGDRLRSVIRSWESMTEVQRLTTNTADGVAKGVRLGNLPPGRKPKFYIVQYKSNGERYLIVNEVEAELARRVYDLYLMGHGENMISSILGKTQSYVRYVLGCAVKLSGRTEVNKRSQTGREYIVAPGNHPAIIQAEIADRVVAEFNRRKGQRRPSKRNQYIYSGLVICDGCNKSMSVDKIKDRDKHYYYVVCHECRRRVPFKKIDEAVTQWTRNIIDQPFPVSRGDNSGEITGLQGELTRLAAKRGKLIDLYTSDLITRVEYVDRLADVNEEETRIKTQVERLQQIDSDVNAHSIQMCTAADALRNMVSTATPQEVNILYRMIFRVYCSSNKQLTVKLT